MIEKPPPPINPVLLTDFYKVSHRPQFPKDTHYIASTWTARRSYMPDVDHTVVFGLQHFIRKYLINYFYDNFFVQPLNKVIDSYERIVTNTLGIAPDHKHIEDLWQLGYLPLRIRALPEGSVVPIRVPWMTIENTDPRFFWLSGYMESLLSSGLWQATTSATIANEYRKVLDFWARKTNPEAMEFVPFQGHDFSFRGMSSPESFCSSGMGHLLSFVGTDTIPAICEAENYYYADVTKELVGTSIPATEHSVMCAGGKEGELETYRRLITDVYPSGFISIVSDTWDLWHVITQTLGTDLHDIVMERDGRVVVRPDSGDPVDIMCGNSKTPTDSPAWWGVIPLLWNIFSGTVSSTGFKVLDPHIGAIYGDSITLTRAEAICERLAAKGFASTNAVYGIGSFTYQYVTRDTFGHAMKGTWVEIGGEEHAIFKDPITDDGMKKSLTGRVVVGQHHGGDFYVIDNLTVAEQEAKANLDQLADVFVNGKLVRRQTFSDIRTRLAAFRNS